MKIKPLTIEEHLRLMETLSPPDDLFAIEDRRAALLSMEESPSTDEFILQGVHFCDRTEWAEPRLAAIQLAIQAYRQGRHVIADPRIGILFGSHWEAGDSIAATELVDMATTAPDNSLVVIKDKSSLVGGDVDYDASASAIWESLERGVGWVALPDFASRGDGLYGALQRMARRRNVSAPVYFHWVTRNRDEGHLDPNIPRSFQGLSIDLSAVDARYREVRSRASIPLDTTLAWTVAHCFDELADMRGKG